MIETMINTPAQWLDASGPDADIVISTHCRLVRNLADYPFTEQCTLDEKGQVENRILDALHNINVIDKGVYYPLPELDELQAQLLVERELITSDIINCKGPRGAYFNDTQSTGITINDTNHLTLISHASGQQLQELWSALSINDDTLAGVLDMAFDDKYGFLTAYLNEVGTGLHAHAIMHLPALTMLNTVQGIAPGQRLTPLYPQKNTANGEYYTIASPTSIGLSEIEIIYHLSQAIDNVIAQERSAREQLTTTHLYELEDRVQRAIGLSQSARLLAFDEGVGVLSSIRLGIANGLLKDVSLKTVNETYMNSHDAHLRLNFGEPCDDIQCSVLRAELFSRQFANK